MNTGFYKDIDTNFEQACEMSEREFSHYELIDMLNNGNIPQKQIAALQLDYIKTQEEADILISNLTGCDGKIREAVALKINQLLEKDDKFAKLICSYADVLADATIDINGNICRLIVSSLHYLKNYDEFTPKYIDKIKTFIYETFDALDKFIFRDKKYVINKQLFKLYWCLEALKIFVKDINKEELFPILERASIEKEYTIREKAAQIINILKDVDYFSLKEKLMNDENYYVRKVFSHN